MKQVVKELPSNFVELKNISRKKFYGIYNSKNNDYPKAFVIRVNDHYSLVYPNVYDVDGLSIEIIPKSSFYTGCLFEFIQYLLELKYGIYEFNSFNELMKWVGRETESK